MSGDRRSRSAWAPKAPAATEISADSAPRPKNTRSTSVARAPLRVVLERPSDQVALEVVVEALGGDVLEEAVGGRVVEIGLRVGHALKQQPGQALHARGGQLLVVLAGVLAALS